MPPSMMNKLMNIEQMSSTEIAKLTGKRKNDIHRDIKTQLLVSLHGIDERNIDHVDIKGITIILDNRGYWKEVLLDHEYALTLVAGYDVNARKIMSKHIGSIKPIIEALNSFEIPDDLPDMYVYAIREVDSGNIKIGISKHPEERLKQLQIANSSRLELVAVKHAVNRFKDERRQHQINRDYHIRGEWFKNSALLA